MLWNFGVYFFNFIFYFCGGSWQFDLNQLALSQIIPGHGSGVITCYGHS